MKENTQENKTSNQDNSFTKQSSKHQKKEYHLSQTYVRVCT